MTTASEYDRPIEIQSKATTLDGVGQEVETWTTVWTPSAKVRPMRGGERFVAKQTMGAVILTFEIRYRPGVTIDRHRIVYDGRIYDVSDVRQIGREQGLEIDASAAAEG